MTRVLLGIRRACRPPGRAALIAVLTLLASPRPARAQADSAYENTFEPEILTDHHQLEHAARLLRHREPELARALAHDTTGIGDSSSVFRALRRSGLPGCPAETRDMIRYGVDHWIAIHLMCLGSGTARQAIAAALVPYGVVFRAAYDSSSCYMRELSQRLLERAGDNRWTELALVEWMERTCTANDGEMWNEIIGKGERFLVQHPRSTVAADVRLHTAEAHETAWALSVSGLKTTDPALPGRAAEHRTRAIALYESFLRSRPRSPEAATVRERLKKIRANIGTRYYRYWCPSVC